MTPTQPLPGSAQQTELPTQEASTQAKPPNKPPADSIPQKQLSDRLAARVEEEKRKRLMEIAKKQNFLKHAFEAAKNADNKEYMESLESIAKQSGLLFVGTCCLHSPNFIAESQSYSDQLLLLEEDLTTIAENPKNEVDKTYILGYLKLLLAIPGSEIIPLQADAVQTYRGRGLTILKQEDNDQAYVTADDCKNEVLQEFLKTMLKKEKIDSTLHLLPSLTAHIINNKITQTISTTMANIWSDIVGTCEEKDNYVLLLNTLRDTYRQTNPGILEQNKDLIPRLKTFAENLTLTLYEKASKSDELQKDTLMLANQMFQLSNHPPQLKEKINALGAHIGLSFIKTACVHSLTSINETKDLATKLERLRETINTLVMQPSPHFELKSLMTYVELLKDIEDAKVRNALPRTYQPSSDEKAIYKMSNNCQELYLLAFTSKQGTQYIGTRYKTSLLEHAIRQLLYHDHQAAAIELIHNSAHLFDSYLFVCAALKSIMINRGTQRPFKEFVENTLGEFCECIAGLWQQVFNAVNNYDQLVAFEKGITTFKDNLPTHKPFPIIQMQDALKPLFGGLMEAYVKMLEH